MGSSLALHAFGCKRAEECSRGDGAEQMPGRFLEEWVFEIRQDMRLPSKCKGLPLSDKQGRAGSLVERDDTEVVPSGNRGALPRRMGVRDEPFVINWRADLRVGPSFRSEAPSRGRWAVLSWRLFDLRGRLRRKIGTARRPSLQQGFRWAQPRRTYQFKECISPWWGQSAEFATRPARPGFSTTYCHFSE